MAVPVLTAPRAYNQVLLRLARGSSRATTATCWIQRQQIRMLPSFVHHDELDASAELVEMIRKIVEGGKRNGRKQDIIRNEVVKVFCNRYSQLDGRSKEQLLVSLARNFTPTREKVEAAVDRYASSVGLPPKLALTSSAPSEIDFNASASANNRVEDSQQAHGHARAYERLREDLSPEYETLFRTVVAESDDGVRFLVGLRQDLLEVLKRSREKKEGDTSRADPQLATLDGSLRSLLQAWFSVGFLELRRITYEDSGGALLEKIARYEAVHPVHSLSELKRRLGHSRRCFAFFHPCLPGEPLVFIHVALLSDMAGSMGDIRGRGRSGRQEGAAHQWLQEEDKARCAVFYSITSTQKGLQGVQLGNFLIKRVVAELRAELPQLDTFVTLSPIPSFREWLSKKAKHRAALGDHRNELSGEPLMTDEEALAILAKPTPSEAEDGDESLREGEALEVLLSNKALVSPESINLERDSGVDGGVAAAAAARKALTRLAARYLVRETVRGRILDPVGNFHVSNGARVERVNWMADSSSKGIDQSFGLMVNYMYDLLEIESNSRQYLSRGEVPASDDLRKLAWSLGEEISEKGKPGSLSDIL